MRKLPIAYELYGMRGDMERSVEGTLKKVKELGFDGVEFAGFFGKSAAEIKALTDSIGLVPVSSHVPLKLMQGSPEATIAYHRELGCRNIVIPYLDDESRPGAPGFARTLGTITRFGIQCREAGLKLFYHNHDFEFRKVSGIYGLDFIFQAVPEELLATEIDTCWVKYAGVDPVSYLLSYKGRAPLVHIKDFVSTNTGRTPYALIGQDAGAPDHSGFSYRPFGHGSQDAPALLQAAVDAGAEWIILEQDDPSGESPYADAKMSMETFASLGF